jgi:hypothetical protein
MFMKQGGTTPLHRSELPDIGWIPPGCATVSAPKRLCITIDIL